MSSQTGMIMNLAKVDSALGWVLEKVPEAATVSKALDLLFPLLNEKLLQAVSEIEISRGSHSIALSDQGYLKKWKTSLLFGNQKNVTSRKCLISYRFYRPHLQEGQVWKNPERFVADLKNHPGVVEVWIQSEAAEDFEIFSW